MRNPKISIVTPAYNSGEYLENCIRSLQAQTYGNYEHIIVDGGSLDGTKDIIKKYEGRYPVKWVSEPDEGMYDAINKGFHMASGEIFAWLNSDDFYFPWTLQVVARAFEKKQIAWLTGIPSATKMYAEENITYLMPNLPIVFCSAAIKKGIYDGKRMPFIQQESTFWTEELWKKAGGIDPVFKMAGDYFLWKKFAEMESLYTVHCNLASFRVHDDQKSADKEGYYKEVGKIRNFAAIDLCRQIYLHLYSLVEYRKYVINLEEIFQ